MWRERGEETNGNYHILNLSSPTSLIIIEVNEDFSATSYFSSRATFAADEGETPANQLNISFSINDDVIAEGRESFVVMIELRPLCETGVLFEVQEQCSLIHITDNDGKLCN